MDKILTLSQWIIQTVAESDKYRAGTLKNKKRTLIAENIVKKNGNIKEGMIVIVGGSKNFQEQAKALKKLFHNEDKFKLNWKAVNTTLEGITFDISIIPELCRLEGIEDPREHQLHLIAIVEEWKKKETEEWIQRYYDDILMKLKAGKMEQIDEMLFRCLNTIVELKDYIWERKLSSDVFQNSKTFARVYKSKIVSVLKTYSPYYVDEMSDDELLTMHKIRSYAQTLEWKGLVQYLIDDVQLIDTSVFRYGTILNSQTLDHSVPYALPGCKRIMTIENKANYENMDYADDTIYIYCHGFFSAKEVKFLKRMCSLAEPDCEFLHWGDLDYGGINIFEFNKENIFPNLMPYKMDASHFKEALARGAGMELKPSTRKKLEKKEAGILNELKEIILETNMVVEQETFM